MLNFCRFKKFYYSSYSSMSSSRPVLRPPSSFEVPPSSSGVSDLWTIVQQTTNEIFQLQEAAKRLKECQQKPREHVNPTGFLKSADLTAAVPVDFAAYDNIIRRLGATIEQLQTQLQRNELDHEKLVGQLRNEQLIKESQQTQYLTDLNAEIEALRKSHDVELRSLLMEREKQEVEWDQLKTDMGRKLKAKDDVIAELEGKLRTFLESTAEELKQKSEEIRQKDQMIEEFQLQLNQLRLYLNESDCILKSSDTWRKETLQLRTQLQLLENEKKHLLSERELVTTRLDSLEAILKIQEQHIDQSSVGSGSTKKCLLTTWREKVFELMIQLKSVDLTSLNEKRNWTSKMSVLEKNLKDMENKCQVLSHVVREKQAAGELEGALAKSLQIELDTAKIQLEKEKTENSRNAASLHCLKDFTMQTLGNFSNLEATIKKLDGSVKSINNRISFASGRVELLKAQFARKEAILKMEFQALSEKDEDSTSMIQPKQELEECRAELERVLSERNSLTAQVALDAQKLQQRIQDATKNATEEAGFLRLRLDDMNEQLNRKSEKADELSCLLEVAHHDLTETRNELQSLKLELERTQTQCKSDLENHEAEMQEDYMRQLSEVKREHTKAVVKVRQLERKMEREREKLTSNMEAMISQHKMEVKTLEERLMITEKDNNILTATLRQEGLLKKTRRLRPFHSEMQLDDKSHSLPLSREELRSNFIPSASGDASFHFGQQRHDFSQDLRAIDLQIAENQNLRLQRPVARNEFHKVAEELKVLASQVLNDVNDEDCRTGIDQTAFVDHCDRTIDDTFEQMLVKDLSDTDKTE